MPEEIIIQETLADRVIYFTTFHVPQEDYNNVEMRESAINNLKSVPGYDTMFKSFAHPFPAPVWGKVCWYVSSTNEQHTKDLAQAILESFKIDYEIKE